MEQSNEQGYEIGALQHRTRHLVIRAGARLGAGGFRRAVSVLTLHANASGRAEVESFGRAVQTCSAGHPGVLPLEDFAEHAGRPFAVSPPLTGAPLSLLVGQLAARSKRISPKSAAGVVAAVGHALGALERAGADLAALWVSADSVWLAESGRPLLLPSALFADAGERRTHLTSAVRISGNDAVSALGVLLWDLLVMGRARSADTDAPTHVAAEIVDPRLLGLVLRSVAEDSRKQFSGVASFVEALEAGWGPFPAGNTELERVVRESSQRSPSVHAVSSAPVGFVSRTTCDTTMEIGTGEIFVAPESSRLVLRVVRGAGPQRQLRLDARRTRWVVGRSASTDLPISDPDMSREHFEIVRTPVDGLRVYDLGSKNGLFVNGAPADSRELVVGDEVSAGKTLLRLEA